MMNKEMLREEVLELFSRTGFEDLNELQRKILEMMKSGKHISVEAPKDAGKTTAVFFCVLQKITQASEGSPRAIVICENDQKAKALFDALKPLCFHLDLTVDLAYERGDMLVQRNDLFNGTEIIVGTPKRLYDLYIQNAFNLRKINFFILDDAKEIFAKGFKMQISRIAESLPKCQYMLLSESFQDTRLQKFMEEFVPYFQELKVEE